MSKQTILSMIFLISVLKTISLAQTGLDPNAISPKYYYDLQNTNRSPYVGAQDSTVYWSFSTVDIPVEGGVIDSEGYLYVGDGHGEYSQVGTVLYKLSANGQIVWDWKPPDRDPEYDKIIPFILTDNGILYYGGLNPLRISAVDISGDNPDFLWSYPLPESGQFPPSRATIGSDGTIFFGATIDETVGFLYALNPDGTLKWSFQLGSRTHSSPALSSDGSTIYIGSGTGLYSVTDGGQNNPILNWNFASDESIVWSSPSVDTDGTIYMGSFEEDGNFYAVNPDGTVKWSQPVGRCESSAAISNEGIIYVTTVDSTSDGRGRLYALNKNDGSVIASFVIGEIGDAGTAIDSSPTIGADGTIYFGSDLGWANKFNLYAVKLNGNQFDLIWKYQVPGHEIDHPIIIGSNGNVYAFHYGGGANGLVVFNSSLTNLNEESEESIIPLQFNLLQNYPNPFNPTTTISFQLQKAEMVNLSIYNIAGQLIEILVSEYKNAGFHSVLWNSSGVGSGLYFYRIEAGKYTATRKCVILK